jgi:radical SAM protein with 4Fe4S-binding SPASM domain
MNFDLELASPCNAKCEFCPQRFRGVRRKRPFMDEALVDKVTTEMGEMTRDEPVHVVLCGMGENLLRKTLVIRALDNVRRASSGAATTELVTNGKNLTLDLLEHESFRELDVIQVSFTGHDKATYEDIFRLDFDRVVENVVAMNRALPGKLHVHAVNLARLANHRSDFERFWNDQGVRVQYGQLHSRGGSLDDPEAYPGRFRPFERCEIFDLICFVSSDGEVLSCCHDVQSAHVLGDCRESTLREIIAHKHELRERAFGGFEICRKCTDFTFERPVAPPHAP